MSKKTEMFKQRRLGKGKPIKVKQIEDDDDNAYDPTHDPDTNNKVNDKSFRRRKFNEISKNKEYADTVHKLYNQLWRPKSIKDLVINKKKIWEFEDFMNAKERKILILQGPSGWGKNALIDTYCNDNRFEIVRFKNTRMLSLNDFVGEENMQTKTSDDFETLLNFINENWLMHSLKLRANSITNKKSLFKAFKTKLTLKERKRISKTPQVIYNGKVAIVDGLPEWMKAYSNNKFEMLADFNSKLNAFLNSDSTTVLVFIFSDPKERNKGFLSKIFNESVLQKPWSVVKRLELNPITDQNITKLLNNVIGEYGIQISKDQKEDIVRNWNKDARHALQTLQFYAAGHTGNELNHDTRPSKRSKKIEDCEKLGNSFNFDEDVFFNSSKSLTQAKLWSQVKNSWSITEKWKDNGKDFGLSIFHALGKFLYNKRIDPKHKDGWRQMNFEELSRKPKPKSYINHQDILNKVQTENTNFTLFLQENMYDFFDDIEDIAKVLEVYWANDAVIGSCTYSYANQKHLYEIWESACLSEALAITEYNLHGGNVKNKLKKMSKPICFELKHQRLIVQNQIKDSVKFSQLSFDNLSSPDLLLMSNRRIVTDYLPYLSYFPLVASLKPILKFGNSHSNTFISDDELVIDQEIVAPKRNNKVVIKEGGARYAPLPQRLGNLVEEDIEDSEDDICSEDIENALLDSFNSEDLSLSD